MSESFVIVQKGKPCGEAKAEKEGLYYHFSCRCRLPSGEMQRLVVSCGGKKEDLGVCVPMDGEFGVEKRIPRKRLGEGPMEFQLIPKDKQTAGEFMPVSPEEPFAALPRLPGAVLEIREGQVGIVCAEE